jgi:hypothetical protein
VTPVVNATLIVWGLVAAVDAGLRLQIHVGLLDRDVDLHRVNPLLLCPSSTRLGVSVLLLLCYPYVREAGYLAQTMRPGGGGRHDLIGMSAGLLDPFDRAFRSEHVNAEREELPMNDSSAWTEPHAEHLNGE